MPKQTLQQKIRRALGRFTAKRIAMILLGAAILSFGIHNIHQRTAITEGGVIGRKLDFLMQEMNREANTIGSKCTDVRLARIVVEIKAELEKIREQTQNIE